MVNDIVEMKFQADYYDGLSASAKPVLVRVIEHTKNISFEVADESLVFNFADLEVQAKLGSGKTRNRFTQWRQT